MDNQIKMLNLTEKDFKLMVDGLDALPQRDMAGEITGDMMMGMLSKGDPEAKAREEKERAQRREKAKADKEMMYEEIKILQGKLLMLKRYLMENKLLNDAVEIINHVQ